MTFTALVRVLLKLLVVCQAVGCDQIRDAEPLGYIQRCGVKARTVGGDRVQVDFIDQQGDSELRCIVPYLGKLTQTTHLLLSNSKITDAGLTSLKGLNNIDMIMLDHTKITDAGLDALATMRRLQILGLTGTAVTEAGIRKLTLALPGVQIERRTRVQEQAIEQIEDLNNRLIHPCSESAIWQSGGMPIGIRLDKVADSDLRQIKEHLEALKESLQEMMISGNGVTDGGVICLKGLSNLRRLTLIGTRVSDLGEKELRRALLHLDVLRLPPGAPLPTALPPP